MRISGFRCVGGVVQGERGRGPTGLSVIIIDRLLGSSPLIDLFRGHA